MTDDPTLAAARARALAARARLDSSLAVAKHKLNPKALAADAVGSAADRASIAAQTGIQVVRDRPGVAAAVAGAVGLAIAHKPIIGWANALLGRSDATSPTSTRSKSSND
ncbi:MAG: hypothetical protein FJ335_09850 [Sphingomonadales bacterium]|nr:hypothetical protein [Sphingomonadales bacterium]